MQSSIIIIGKQEGGETLTKKLSELALLIPDSEIIGDDISISGIEHDSRKVTAKNLFVCMEGAHVDGHNFIPQATAKGAVAILTTRKNFMPPENISALIVPDMLNALAVIVPYFYDYPSRAMRVIGITGTNGKTTTTYLLREIFKSAGFKVGLIGTIQILIGDESFPVRNTTPNVIDLQHLLNDMRAKKIQIVIMEVSSHALAEHRVAGVEFDTAIFTNLTQDHLDFHLTIENYLRAKCKLFDMVSRHGRKKNKTAIINVDDAASDEILKHCLCKKITYGLKNFSADLRGTELEIKSDGMNLFLVPASLFLSLHITGLFNVCNVLAAVGAATAENIRADVIKTALENFKSVPGRFERIFSDAPFEVIVDYAHTPDGVKNVLETARQIVTGKIITVVGCGGDRDHSKRPIMGKLAAELSDVVIATSDNPRTEDPEKILDDIEVGIGDKIHERIVDRRAAIFRAVELAEAGDIVLILGKGHETYQILNGGTIHFDDREVAKEAIDEDLGVRS
ncbi:MAG: UDP-N-acetylmuramoyl-L-alanyl-D-glutamate--2,6-diaminopimelate ligase [Selenomonadaceae bacterium]|nr:UDP-N-acetylmuramoyl-L-alanyl-D-glutamate--2,6-diaminopimelate ligase [Selenomonadaceae bacterium]